MSEKKGIGIPRGLFFYRYRPFLTNFADSIDADIAFGAKTNDRIRRAGQRSCHERACAAEKIFTGHCQALQEKGYEIFVPADFRPHTGSKSCAGEASTAEEETVCFKDELWQAVGRLGVTKRDFDTAFANGAHAQKYTVRGYNNQGYPYKILLAGRPYNIYDEYANLNIVSKLHRMGIGVVTQERLLERTEKEIQGVIYVCCFGCNDDAVCIADLRKRFDTLPFLVIETGEHLYKAGLNARLEAFKFLIEERSRRS